MTADETAQVAAEQLLRRILAQLGDLQVAHAQLEHDLVWFINALGMSFDRIGEAHDPPISRQAVRKRYSHPKRRRRKG